MQTHDLPTGVPEWVADVGGGEITHLQRHIARREAWVVDVKRADGGVTEGFLRLERTPIPDNPWSLERETRIVQTLKGTAVPVPDVIGYSKTLGCTLFERVPGRADLQNAPPAQQRPVMEHFIDVVADLHRVDLDRFPTDEFPRPTTTRDIALGEMDRVVQRWSGFLSKHHDPLIAYGIDWLERFVPKSVSRVSLVQGDTGPVNFMFEGNRVTSVIDWEWAHLGDPMEDLGNICVREFWNPCGGLTGLMQRYQDRSGLPVDLAAVRYYRVQQNMRGMVPIAERTVIADPHESLAWYLAYRYVGDRSTLESMAESMGVTIELPEMPKERRGKADPLAVAAEWALEHDVCPGIEGAFAQSRARDVQILVQCMERVRRYGDDIWRADRAELSALLGRRLRTEAAGIDALQTAIRERRIDDERMIQFLGRRTFRLEWLYAPCTQLYPNRRWATLD